MNTLQSMKRMFQTKTPELSKLNTQEGYVDEWDIDSPQSAKRKEVAIIVAEKMGEIFLETTLENCEGCQLNLGNQEGHFCVIERKDQAHALFNILLEKINIEKELKEMNVVKEELTGDEEWCKFVIYYLCNEKN